MFWCMWMIIVTMHETNNIYHNECFKLEDLMVFLSICDLLAGGRCVGPAGAGAAVGVQRVYCFKRPGPLLRTHGVRSVSSRRTGSSALLGLRV